MRPDGLVGKMLRGFLFCGEAELEAFQSRMCTEYCQRFLGWALPLTSRVTLGKSLDISESYLSYLPEGGRVTVFACQGGCEICQFGGTQ